MRIYLFLIFLWICGNISAEIYIMTFNVHNFFDQYDDPYTKDKINSTAIVKKKMQNISAIINKYKPNIIALQEIENKHILERLNAEYLNSKYEVILIEANNSSSIYSNSYGLDVGLLTSLPVHSATTYQNRNISRNMKFVRDLLHVKLYEGTNLLNIFVAHAISGNNNSAKYIRKYEFEAYYSIIKEVWQADTNSAIILCGDFNCSAEDKDLKKFYDFSKTNFLKFIKAEDKNKLTYTWSSKFSKYKPAAFDHFFVSHSVYSRISDKAKIIDLPKNVFVSDHRPVLLKLNSIE